MSKHTPGPWTIRRGHSTVQIRTAAGLHLAQTTSDKYWQDFSEEALANARLIAAAPDLYEAVRALLEFPGGHYAPALERKAREALRKAEGGES